MPDIRHAIQISTAGESIHRLVATAPGFREWWAADVTDGDGVEAHRRESDVRR